MHESRAVFVELADTRGESVDKGNGGGSRLPGIARDGRDVEEIYALDRLGGRLRDPAEARLRPCQRGFELEQRRKHRAVGKQIRELFGGSEAVNQSRRHEL